MTGDGKEKEIAIHHVHEVPIQLFSSGGAYELGQLFCEVLNTLPKSHQLGTSSH